MAPSDATVKNRNIGAQLQSILYTTAQKDLGKFTSCSCWTFGAHKLVHSDYPYELWQLLSALYSDVQKNHIGAHLESNLGHEQLRWNFLQISQALSYLYVVVRTNFSADFWTFRNFWRQFREICVAQPSNKNEKLCSVAERAVPSENKAENLVEIGQ